MLLLVFITDLKIKISNLYMEIIHYTVSNFEIRRDVIRGRSRMSPADNHKMHVLPRFHYTTCALSQIRNGITSNLKVGQSIVKWLHNSLDVLSIPQCIDSNEIFCTGGHVGRY